MQITFTISESSYRGFVIGEKFYNIKCQANSSYNCLNISQRELFNTMANLNEQFNNKGLAVLFEVE